MAAVGSAFVQVVPSMTGFHRRLKSDLSSVRATATATIEPVVDKAAAKQADAELQRLADRLNTAREKEAAAAGKVRVAEAQLADVRRRGNATTAQITAAEEKLTSAKRSAESASRAVARATSEENTERQRLASTTDDLNGRTSLASRAIQRLTVDVDVNRGRMSSLAGSVLRAGAAFTALSVAGVGAAHGVASLGAALAPTVGAVALLPAAGFAAAAGIGALAIGMSGFGDAIKNVGDPEKFAEAIKDLAPAARATAIAIRDLQPAFHGLRNAVQQQLFAGMATQVRELAAIYLPVLRDGLSGIAAQANAAAQSVADVLKAPASIADMRGMFANTEAMFEGMAKAAAPLTQAFRDIAAVGSTFLPGFGAAIARASQAFANFIAQARATGQLRAFIQGALDAFAQLGVIVRNVGSIIYSTFQAAGQAGGNLLATLGTLTGEAARFLNTGVGQQALVTVFRTLRDTVHSLLPGLRAVAGALARGIVAIGPALPAVGAAFSNVAKAVAPLITDLFRLAAVILPPLAGLLSWIAPIFGPLAAGVLAVAAAFRIWSFAAGIVNAVLLANPIVLVVGAIIGLVAAVIYAYNHFTWFRNIVQGAWNGIVAAALWAWNTILRPTFSAISTAVIAVGGFFMWLWRSVIVPAWNGIVAAALWAWNTVLSPIFSAIGFAARVLAAVFATALVAPFVIGWNVLSGAALWAWNTVLSPVFSWIGDKARWLWANVLSPTFAAIGVGWSALATGVRWAVDNIVIPAWNVVRNSAMWLWNTILRPTFTAIGFAWSVLVSGVRAVIDNVLLPAWRAVAAAGRWLWNTILRPTFTAIGNAWRVTMDAIRWAYDHILRPAFDAVRGAVRAVGQAFQNTANWIRDAWSKISGYAKAPINFVIDVVYNRGIRSVWNGIAGIFGLGKLNKVPMLAAGGAVPAGPMVANSPTAIVGEGNPAYPEYVIPTDPKYRGRANALWQQAGTQLMADGGILGDIWGGVKNVGSTIAGGIGKAFNWVMSIAGNVAGGVRKLFSSVLGDAERTPGSGTWTEALRKIPTKTIEAVIEKVKGWFSSNAQGGAYGATPVAFGSGVARWAPVVLQALRMLGQPASYLGITLRRMQQESGGNPNIGNYWDINAQRGTPSMGLMQTIGPTFAAYRDPRAPNNILDPLANILASMRYVLARYGSLPAAYNRPGGYDSGGWLPPGMNLTYNGTGKPEAILTGEQWEAIQSVTEQGTNGNTITVNAATNATPEHIAASIDRRLSMATRV